VFEQPDLAFRPPIAHEFTGETLGGRYRLERRLGYGGSASIYLATCKNTGAISAVKVLHPELDSEPVAIQRFKQEAQLGAQIRHPNLIPVYDAGWQGGRHFLVMELIEGKSLAKVLADGPITWERSAVIVRDVLAGLAALHERGVVHRDISPNNVLLEVVGGRERARLSDLGYARVLVDASETDGLALGMPPESVPTVIYGTPHFIAPERLRGGAGDFRADIFSVGALWYAMLTGEPLPEGADPVALAHRLELPSALRAVLLGALEIRVRRHHGAASMAAAIDAALAGRGRRRDRVRRLVSFAPLLSLLVFPAWLAFRPEPATPVCSESVGAPSPARHDPVPLALTASAAHQGPHAPEPVSAASRKQLGPDPLAAIAEPASGLAEPATAASRNSAAPTSRVRLALRRALAKCKPHPTARIEVTITPGERALVDGERATGELGRCIENVLLAHPPQRAETFKL
jgi:serine/threonine protein kinase